MRDEIFGSGETLSAALAESLITPDLDVRPARVPNFDAEADLLRTMGRQMAEQPETLLSNLAEAVVGLCSGESAGVTLVCREGDPPVLKVAAAAGVMRSCHGAAVEPFSPCGYALARQQPQLFRNPSRCFAYLADLDPPVREFLTVPLIGRDGPVGTLWVAVHGSDRQLDGEDRRVLEGLASFTLTAVRQQGLFAELTEARRDAGQLKQRLGALLDSISDGLAFLDEDLRFVHANEECATLMGRRGEPLVGLRLPEIVRPEIRKHLRADVAAALQSKRQLSFDWQVDEGERWIEVKLYPAASGGACLLVSDISERRQVEVERTGLLKAAERNAERLKELATASGAIGAAIDLQSTLQEITNYAARIIGAHQSVTTIAVDREGAPSISAVYLSDKYDRRRASEGRPGIPGVFPLIRQLEGPVRRTQAELEDCPELRNLGPAAAGFPPMRGFLAVPLVRHDGRNFGWIQLSDKEEGEFSAEDESILIQLAHFASSAAEKAWVEEALRESQERLTIAVEAGQFGVFEACLPERVVTLSSTCCSSLGLEPDVPVPFEAALEVIHHQDREQVREVFRKAIGESDRCYAEFRSCWSDGTLHWVAVFARVVRDEEGVPARIIGVSSDISQRKQTEEELRSINQTLEQRVEKRTAVANRRADQLSALALELTQAEQRERRRIAQVLHDHLQQILVAAKLRLGMLMGGARSGSDAEALSQVSDLLGRSIEASRDLTVELSPPILFDGGLGPGLEWLSRRMKEQHGLIVHVKTEGQEELNTYVKAFFFQTTRELLFNIVKHAGVREAFVEMSIGEDGEVRIEVRDEGSGFVAPEKTGGRGGDGFGLSSLRERVVLLGGRLSIRSRPGEGTTVTLVAPARTAEDESAARELLEILTPEEKRPPDRPAAPEASEERPLRVVLADDHKILREGLVGLLQDQPGVEVVGEASDGQMAVELALRDKPDIVIMDISMPRLNGIEATREIVSQWPQAVVIGLSMHDKEDMATAIMEAGAKAYVTKGAPSEILVQTIWNLAPFSR